MNSNQEMISILHDLKDTFKASCQSKRTEGTKKKDPKNAVVSECLEKYYGNTLTFRQRMVIKCYLAEFSFKAEMLKTMHVKEIN